jgi:hypothetical protein
MLNFRKQEDQRERGLLQQQIQLLKDHQQQKDSTATHPSAGDSHSDPSSTPRASIEVRLQGSNGTESTTLTGSNGDNESVATVASAPSERPKSSRPNFFLLPQGGSLATLFARDRDNGSSPAAISPRVGSPNTPRSPPALSTPRGPSALFSSLLSHPPSNTMSTSGGSSSGGPTTVSASIPVPPPQPHPPLSQHAPHPPPSSSNVSAVSHALHPAHVAQSSPNLRADTLHSTSLVSTSADDTKIERDKKSKKEKKK